MQRTMRKGMLATTAVSALLALTFVPGAGASMSAHDGGHHRRHHHHHHLVLTDVQKQCLADQGFTLPMAGTPHDATKPDEAAFAAFRQALVTCGILPARVEPDPVVPPTTPPPATEPTVSSFRSQSGFHAPSMPANDGRDGSRFGGEGHGWQGANESHRSFGGGGFGGHSSGGMSRGGHGGR